jgi:YidC/Oxa1 family membrane protein insertase
MKMDSDIMVMTMPDLEVYHYKRSIVKKDIEYIYTDHGMGSFHLTHRKGAIDNYDTIFCYSTNHNEEVRAIESVYDLPEKKLVNVGFDLVDRLTKEHEMLDAPPAGTSPKREINKPQILIAPSWQKDSIFDCCLDPLLNGLFKLDAKIIIRPHPEFVKRFPGKIKAILEKYAHKAGNDFEVQTDFSSNATVYSSDIVITDWSSIAQEFSFTTKKPTLFINTPMKVMNPEWQKIGIEPMDIWIRDKIGVSVDIDKLDDIDKIALEMFAESDVYESAIEDLLRSCLYNKGRAAQTGGKYIIEQVEKKRNHNALI